MNNIKAIYKLTFLVLLLSNHILLAQRQDSIYSETGEASFLLTKDKEGIVYQTVETSFKIVDINLQAGDFHQQQLAKYITETTTRPGIEGQQRLITVTLKPVNQLSRTVFTTKQNCDELQLYPKYFKTIKYGCCADLNQISFFDYTNAEIITGSDKIITALIPNNDIRFYVAYNRDTTQQSSTLGTVTISYGSSQKYHITLTSSKPLPEETCVVNHPDITIISSDKNDELSDKDEILYNLFSLQDITAIKQINKISLRVSFYCDKSIKPFTIPIINGLPFGKNQKEQSYHLSRR